MRLYSAYINMQAARDADSGFEPERYVRQIYREGERLWELSQIEQKEDKSLSQAESKAEIPSIIKDEEEEYKAISEVANRAFSIIRDSILLLHSQLFELKKLVKDDEVLKNSGFPIEVADQLENMLKQEINKIVSHLHEIAREIKDDKAA